jgi:hypothetical protein
MSEKVDEEESEDEVLRNDKWECDDDMDEGGDGCSCRCAGRGERACGVGVVIGIASVVIWVWGVCECIECTADPRCYQRRRRKINVIHETRTNIPDPVPSVRNPTTGRPTESAHPTLRVKLTPPTHSVLSPHMFLRPMPTTNVHPPSNYIFSGPSSLTSTQFTEQAPRPARPGPYHLPGLSPLPSLHVKPPYPTLPD